ncbi:MAG: hypothetical protein A2049_09455 [Elusimicrobia bacterium GWA2_62_23]|nr:MAG: hypothetical protein A2049_09455 [Elusimicrobia bacterium GWA2_62_23]OGR68305.1 MAG: hypothetical protein A2179_03095 [Elusimicrobia bacterium GWC2_63_65]
MDKPNPFAGVKTYDNYTHIWQLTGFILLLQVIVAVLAGVVSAIGRLHLSDFEATLPAVLVMAYVSYAVLEGLGVNWRDSLADWGRRPGRDLLLAVKYFLGYALLLGVVFAALMGAYGLLGDGLAAVMRPVTEKNTVENAALQGVAAVSRLRFLLVLFSACVVAPVAEEIFFRRIVFTTIRLKKGFWPAAFWSGLLFALFHGAAAPIILPCGIYLAWVYERERRLPVNILLHSMVNLTMVTLKVLLL